ERSEDEWRTDRLGDLPAEATSDERVDRFLSPAAQRWHSQLAQELPFRAERKQPCSDERYRSEGKRVKLAVAKDEPRQSRLGLEELRFETDFAEEIDESRGRLQGVCSGFDQKAVSTLRAEGAAHSLSRLEADGLDPRPQKPPRTHEAGDPGAD